MKLLGRTTWSLNYPYLLASADGLNWHFFDYGPSTPPSVSFRANSLHHAGGLFVELADRLFSANLVDWTPFDIPGDSWDPCHRLPGRRARKRHLRRRWQLVRRWRLGERLGECGGWIRPPAIISRKSCHRGSSREPRKRG
jgi:hypothetical protein